MSSTRPDAWSHALRWLTTGDRSEHEVRARLQARGHEAAEIEQAILRLNAAGFLNDSRLAENAAQSAVRGGRGSERVRAQLTQRGVDSAGVEAAIATAFGDELDLARTALGKRFLSPLRTPAEHAKAARFLAQRGFPESIIRSVLPSEDW